MHKCTCIFTAVIYCCIRCIRCVRCIIILYSYTVNIPNFVYIIMNIYTSDTPLKTPTRPSGHTTQRDTLPTTPPGTSNRSN